VDFSSGHKFGLSYTNKNNEPEVPLIIHRAPLGTHERFIGFLLEHYAGKLPVWLNPQQVRVLPISDKYVAYAKGVVAQLRAAGIRAAIDERSEKIGKKIREAELQRVSYMMVAGEKEAEAGMVALRRQGRGDVGTMPIAEAIARIRQEVNLRTDAE
jgi:threonyl-tRNA synthetase